jgi:hypothetical protein
MAKHPLIRLAAKDATRRVTRFQQVATGLTGVDLARLYRQELEEAPRHDDHEKAYFVGHDGIPGAGERTTRDEEHLAIALVNSFGAPNPGLRLPTGGNLSLLDYQVPLRARQSDAGVGDIDLLGLLPGDRLAALELKFLSPSARGASGADTPLRALLQALAYCAALEANLKAVRSETVRNFGRGAAAKPGVVVLANVNYWKRYREARGQDGSWTREFDRLALELDRELGLPIQFLALELRGNPLWEYRHRKPYLTMRPKLLPAW